MHAQFLRERHNVLAALQSLHRLPAELVRITSHSFLCHLQFLSLHSVPFPSVSFLGFSPPVRTRIMFESRQGYHLFLQFVALTECLGGIRWGSRRFACFNAGEMNDTRGSAVYGRRDRQNRTRVQAVVPRVRSG